MIVRHQGREYALFSYSLVGSLPVRSQDVDQPKSLIHVFERHVEALYRQDCRPGGGGLVGSRHGTIR